MNNEERIKKMDTWELAEFIYGVSNHETKMTTCEDMCEECNCSDDFCVSGIAEWLKEEE